MFKSPENNAIFRTVRVILQLISLCGRKSKIFVHIKWIAYIIDLQDLEQFRDKTKSNIQYVAKWMYPIGFYNI